MNSECSVVRDLLPLYAEGMVRPDTSAFVQTHLESCPLCRQEARQMNRPQAVPSAEGAAPLRKLRRKMAAKQIQTIALTAVFVIALLFSVFAVLDTPVYLPCDEAVLAAAPTDGGGVEITFRSAVTDFACTLYRDPDGGDFYYCDVEAWYSLWDRWFTQGDGMRLTTVAPREPGPITVYYLPNDGTESVCLYGAFQGEHSVTLPRLALGYYLWIAAAALAALAVAWAVVRKKPKVRLWVERAALYPASYILSHLIVKGIRSSSYAMVRDFSLILCLSLLLYCALLLFHSILRLRKEIREIGR